MDEIIDQIKAELENVEKMTIPQLCVVLDIKDEFVVSATIAELESRKEVQLKSMLPFYAPNGDVGYLPEYGCIVSP